MTESWGCQSKAGAVKALSERSANEVANTLVNPVAPVPVTSLDFKLQFQRYQGSLPSAAEQSRTQLLFQPVLPFSLDDCHVILFRPAIPLIFDQPVYDQGAEEFHAVGGVGDISFDLVYGKTTDQGVLAAAGVVSTLPTATNDNLGNDSFTLGPEVLFGRKGESYLLSLLASHQWDIAGWSDENVSLTTMQLFGIFLPGDGWTVGTTPVLSYDHIGKQWTVPLNFVFSKTLISRKRPWKLGIGFNYFIEQADSFGPDWMVSFNVTPVVDHLFSSQN